VPIADLILALKSIPFAARRAQPPIHADYCAGAFVAGAFVAGALVISGAAGVVVVSCFWQPATNPI